VNARPGLRDDFGSFRLEPGRHLLLYRGEPAHLKPKVFDLLVFLVENRDRLVTKRELMDGLWRDQFVEESNLSQSVYELRRVLGVEPGASSYVENVPRRGYRFVAEVRVSGEEAQGGRPGQETREQVAGIANDHRAVVVAAGELPPCRGRTPRF
jgi:DNA-binding winged helix-turn-helix (wHTH) protein